MYNNNYMYGVERSNEYLAHYGIRGMKWGVRKAIKSGNSARLSKQYAKASKKLAKLEKRAANTGKYARRAALMGAGAAAAGGLAVAGTSGVSTFMKNNAKYAGKASKGIGKAMVKGGQLMSRIPGANKAAGKVIGAGYNLQAHNIKNANAVYNAGMAVDKWGKSKSISEGVGNALIRQGAKGTAASMSRMKAHYNGASEAFQKLHKGDYATRAAFNGPYKMGQASTKAGMAVKNSGVSNNTIARVAAGAVGAGLAAGAAKNAYRAATAKKKAAKFKTEMNKAFAGTKYANGGQPRQGKKRRR